jgi:hypothetical protein
MAIKNYLVKRNVDCPAVYVTGLPHQPQGIRYKKYRKGDIIRGEMKHANNQPAIVLVEGSIVVPIDAVNELTTKEIVSSNADGDTTETKTAAETIQKVVSPSPKIQYMDATIGGAVAGAGIAYLLEKQTWIVANGKKNYLIGAAIGAAAALYLVYRYKTNKAVKPKK